MKKSLLFIALTILLAARITAQQDASTPVKLFVKTLQKTEEKDNKSEKRYGPNYDAEEYWVCDETEAADHLQALLASYTNLSDWEKRKKMLRENILRQAQLDPLPQKSPLNPIYGKTRRFKGYTVTNVALETVHGYWLCGSLYQPDNNKGITPAMLSPHGHFYSETVNSMEDLMLDDARIDFSERGRYRSDQQYRCAMLARMGVTVFSYDMFAFGGESSLQIPYAEGHHSSFALTMQLWNSMRVTDFLCSLETIDQTKIGITGASGGGTQTFLLAAVDPRITFSIPAVMVSAHFYGGCGCESGLPIHQTPYGLNTNNVEIAAMIAPRPQLLISIGTDWTKNTPTIELPYLKKIYDFYESADHVENVHLLNEQHDYGYSKREALYNFVSRVCGIDVQKLKDAQGRYNEKEITIEAADDLLVFGDGRIVNNHYLRQPNKTRPMMPATHIRSIDDLKKSIFDNLHQSLPKVFDDPDNDIISQQLVHDATLAANAQSIPESKEKWEEKRVQLRQTIMEKAGITVDHQLALDCRELSSREMAGYTVKNVIFQTRPGIYATATLYAPKGAGPFPAAVVMMGHSQNGRLFAEYQQIGHALAMNGYVALNVDPWGAGERTNQHGNFEYHGANLGASLMNIGETLLGMQVVDNMRAIDLLCSLPYVDPKKIGATGCSGGGNQTMWLSILDERVQASVPVVSVGTFESYVMSHNCICELLPDGLTFTEEAGALGLVAPRALKICTAFREMSNSFSPAQMFRTYKNLRPVYNYFDADEKLSYFIADVPHGYLPEFREAMLGWFDLHLQGKGTGAPKKEMIAPPFFSEIEQMAYEVGKRDPLIITTAGYCQMKGEQLRKEMLAVKTLDVDAKKKDLGRILKLASDASIIQVHRLPDLHHWERLLIETSFGTLIPVLHRAPTGKDKKYVMACSIDGKAGINPVVYDEAQVQGAGVLLLDLWGTGEGIPKKNYYWPEYSIAGNLGTPEVATKNTNQFHTLSRSALWLGKRMTGIWVNELEMVVRYLTNECGATAIKINADKETGLAALFLAAFNNDITELELSNTPVSYLFDQREGIDYFTMAIYLPAIMQWGDVSLAAGLSGKNITFTSPVTMSGRSLTQREKNDFIKEYAAMRKACGQHGNTIFK